MEMVIIVVDLMGFQVVTVIMMGISTVLLKTVIGGVLQSIIRMGLGVGVWAVVMRRLAGAAITRVMASLFVA